MRASCVRPRNISNPRSSNDQSMAFCKKASGLVYRVLMPWDARSMAALEAKVLLDTKIRRAESGERSITPVMFCSASFFSV